MIKQVVMAGLLPGRLLARQRQQVLISIECMQAHGAVAEGSALVSGRRTLLGFDERRVGGWFNEQAQRKAG